MLEGELIIVAAFSILREAYLGFLHPKSLETPLQGLVLNGTASLIKRALVLHPDPIWTLTTLARLSS